MRVRIIKDIEGVNFSAAPGSVLTNISSPSGANLINAGFAILEAASPSGSIGTLFNNSGFVPLTPSSSGYVGPSGWIHDIPAGQAGYYFPGDYSVTVVMPGKFETTFDILKFRPRPN